jgi:hypothetical protein
MFFPCQTCSTIIDICKTMALGLRMRPHPTNLVLVMPANFEDMK